LNSPVALVTGGARGLGASIVHSLQSKGYQVVVFDLVEYTGDLTVESIKVDVTNEDQLIEAVAAVDTKFGRIDVLVNCAGSIYSKPLFNLSDKNNFRHDYGDFRRVLDLNLNSVFLVTSIVCEKMLRRRVRGCVVNISSICASGNAGQTAYAAAKAGVESMTKVWAKELGGLGIRINAVAPGFIDTQSTREALSEAHIQTIRTEIPLNRLGKADDVARAVVYATENDFVNGAVLNVDGGMVL